MKKLFLVGLTAIALAATQSSLLAASGIFGASLGLRSNKFNSGENTFFEASLVGDSRHAPIASSTVTLPVVLDTGGNFNRDKTDPALRNLGTFDGRVGDTLTFIGGDILTFKNNGSNVTAAFVNVRIDNGAFQTISLGFNQDLGSGDQRWASTNGTIDLLAGLTNGTHTISFFFSASTSDGDRFDSRNGSNYNATFTVIPEPSTYVAGALSIVAVAFTQRRRIRGLFA